MGEDTLGVALTKEACPICAKTVDGPIVMNTWLTKGEAKKVKELHGKTLNWMKEPCDECKDMMTKGFILIGAVEKKSPDVTNPYRSGNIWCVKQEVAIQLFGPNPPASGVAFIDINVAKQLELPGINMDA